MTSLPLTGRVGARLSASPALDLSVSNRGDLMIGQMKIIRDELAKFFPEKTDHRAERGAS
jgi:hypothetical protein